MLAIFLLVFASITTIATLAIIANTRMSGGTRAYITCYNAGIIVTMILAAIQLMK